MLKLYGLGASQPCRAVWWACLIKGLPFELRHVSMEHLGAGAALSHLNPIGQIPIIDDEGYLLCEMPAILIYLSKKHGWTDLYPDDLKTSGLIDQYLHFHHNRTRILTTELMAPHAAEPFVDLAIEMAGGLDAGSTFFELAKNPNKLGIGQKVARAILSQLEAAYFRDTQFLCTDSPTISDIACYQEVAQLKWANLFDFERFPKISDWLEQMTKLAFHDSAHQYNIELGDIASEPNTVERFMQATTAAADALANHGVIVTPFK